MLFWRGTKRIWFGIRCLDEDKLFPAENPVFCDEKNEHPFYDIQCCGRDDFCNKNITFKFPKKGEIFIKSPAKKKHTHKTTSIWNGDEHQTIFFSKIFTAKKKKAFSSFHYLYCPNNSVFL